MLVYTASFPQVPSIKRPDHHLAYNDVAGITLCVVLNTLPYRLHDEPHECHECLQTFTSVKIRIMCISWSQCLNS